MKKITLALALTAGFVLAGYAEEQAAENPFQKANEAFTTSAKKMTSNSWMKGKVEIKEKDGKQVYEVTPDDPKVKGSVYNNNKVDAKAGDKIQIRIKASGKGQIQPALWCYPKQVEGQREKFLTSVVAKPQKLTEESKELRFELVISQKEVAYVRTAINFFGGTEAVLEEVEFKFAE